MIGSLTYNYLNRNITRVRSDQDDITIVTLVLTDLIKKLETMNQDDISKLELMMTNFGDDLIKMNVSPAGKII